MIHLTDKHLCFNVINDELVYYYEITHHYLPVWDEEELK